MSKDILAPAQFSWEFVGSVPEGLDDVDPNDWAVGTRLVIPSDVLVDREVNIFLCGNVFFKTHLIKKIM